MTFFGCHFFSPTKTDEEQLFTHSSGLRALLAVRIIRGL